VSTPVRDELATLDATGQAELVRNGELTPLELVEAAIGRIEEIDPKLNSVIHRFFEEAREEAAGDLPDGPFRGVPFLLKDLGVSFAGQPLHMGMRLLKEIDFRAPADSHLALRFRDAGLVTVGKTNTPEIGIVPTTEPVAYGPTRNPWDTSRSAGGSSGGSGAAVATGLVPFAHASDGGGSIRIPASHNGLVGLKTTRGRTSAGPLAGDFASGLSEHFALTRSVRDAAALLDAVHGPSAGDPYAATAPRRPYVEELGTSPGKLRIAMITRSAVETQPSADALAALRSAAELLSELGHEVEELEIIGEGLGDEMPGAFIKRWASGMAQTIRLFGRVIGRPVTKDDVEPLTWALGQSGEQVAAPEYLEAIGLHQLVGRTIGGIYEGGVDLLMTPTVGEKPPPLGEFDDSGPEPFRALKRAEVPAMFTSLFNATGQPAISVPLHWTDDDLPLGVQFAAPLGEEGILIRIAAQLEQARPWAERLASVGLPG
jgi:amidase